jgi:hypothetical protein
VCGKKKELLLTNRFPPSTLTKVVDAIAAPEITHLAMLQVKTRVDRLYYVIFIIRCIVVFYLKDTCDRYSFYNYLLFPRVI